MNYKCRLKIILVILTFLFSYSNLKAEEEVGSQHAVGLGFLLSYEYEEPTFMHLRAGFTAEGNETENIGLIYNYKNSFIANGYLSEIELDTSYQYMTQSYWSNSSGTISNKDLDIYNIKALYGIKLSRKLMLKSGIGYRYLYDYGKNVLSSTGALGYDREQDYTYIPIIAELKSPNGILKIEFDHVFDGNNTSYLGYIAGYEDLDFKNDNGFMYKMSFKKNIKNLIYEPYFEFMSIEESNIVGGSKEPANTTHEIGIKISKSFSTIKSSISNYKNIFNNDQFYLGTQLLMSEVESGFYSPTGTAKIEEEGTGFSIVSGIRLYDNIKSLPIKLDLVTSYNHFAKSVVKCNSGDTLTTDGRYDEGAYAAGTILTCGADNNDVVIESFSVSFGIKPSFKLINSLLINADIGLHRWDQSENDFIPNNSTTNLANYAGTDIYMGIGLEYKYNNLSAEIGYLEHTMKYDAKSFTGGLKYNF